MADEKPVSDPESDDPALDDLILEAREAEPEVLVRPSQEAVLAFLQGVATEDQRSEVQRALLRSKEFRGELVQLGEDLAHLGGPEAVSAFADVPIPGMPVWEPKGFGREVRRVAGAVVELLKSSFSPLQPSQFAPVLLRGTDTAEACETAEEAAILSFTQRVEWLEEAADLNDRESGLRVIEEPPARRAAPGAHVTLSLQIHDTAGVLKREVAAVIPEEHESWRVWVLLVPSLELFGMDMEETSLAVHWPGDEEGIACVAFTYETPDGFMATPAALLEIA